MIHLYLVRHGTTKSIENRVMEGKLDSPLSPHGQDEAKRAAYALQNSGIEYAFSSPMKRTKETAEIICDTLGLDYILVNELREMDFGIYEGRNYFEVPDKNSSAFERFGLIARIMIAQITGEPLARVSKRARNAWKVVNNHAKEGRILIVSHGALINYLIKSLLSVEYYKQVQPIRTDPCSISELKVTEPGNTGILRLNDIRHLTKSPKYD